MLTPSIDPKLDLVLDKTVDISAEQIWNAWTKPELLKRWFTPAPWKTAECHIDLKPGGIFQTTMQGPNGESAANNGCYLEIIPKQRLIWTTALQAGFRPSQAPVKGTGQFLFTGIILLEPRAKGTRYQAIGRHSCEEDKLFHENVGFHNGWNLALDQLVALMKAL